MKKQFFISILILVITTTIICLGWTPATCLQTDSYFYESAAQNLLKGNGYSVISKTTRELTHFTHFPPLTSLVVALIMFITGCSSYFAFKLISIFTFSTIAIIVFFSITNNEEKKLIWGILGTLVIILCKPLIDVFLLEQSEPIFLLLITINALCIYKYINNPSFKLILMLGIITSLSFLSRYSGVYLIVSNSLIILLYSRDRILKRIYSIFIYGGIFSITFFTWFIRNYFISGEIHDHQMEDGIFERIIIGFRELTFLTLPGSFSPFLRYSALILFFAFCFYYIYVCANTKTLDTKIKLSKILFTQAFVYVIFQTIMCFIILTRLNSRTLSSFYFPLFFAIFTSISENISENLNKKFKYIFILCISLFLLLSAARIFETVYQNINTNKSSLINIRNNNN